MAGQGKNKKNLRLEAYKLVKERILFLELKPGEKVFENVIAETLGSSRTPVREALFALENEGLLEFDLKLGHIVKLFSGKDVEQYIGIRKALELYAAPLVIKGITSEQIIALKKNIQAAEKCVRENELKGCIRCETEFHEIIYKSTDSNIFYKTISGLMDKFQIIRAIVLFGSDAPALSIRQHEIILQAIIEKDIGKLEQAILLHIDSALERYRRSPAVALFERRK